VFSQFGPLELILILVIVLVIFGPKLLPSLGRHLGSGMREFKESRTGERKGDDEREQAQAPPALMQAPPREQPADAPVEPAPTESAPEHRG